MGEDKIQGDQKTGTVKKPVEDAHDDILEKILSHAGAMGRYQKLLVAAMMLFGYTCCFIYYVQMFITATPENHWCRVPELANLSMELRKYLSAPGAASGEWDHCRTFDANWSDVLATMSPPADGTPLVACQHGWEFELSDIPYETVTTERGWVCDRASNVPTAQSIFYVGAVIGGLIIGWIADRFGRVPALVVTNLVGGIGSVATVFTTTVWDFILCRFLVGLSFNTSFMILYVLVLEYVGVKYRTLVANLTIALSYTVAGAIIPWMAYYIANWRILLWSTSLPMFIVVVAPWVLPESVQWLVSRGRIDDAVKVLKRFEVVNKTKIPDDVMDEFIVFCDKTKQEEKLTILEVCKSKQLRVALLCLILLFMGCGMDLDGLTRLSDSFELSFFAVITFHGVFEFLSFMLVIAFLDRLGRRKSTSGTAFVTAVVLIVALFVPEGIPQAVLAIAARFFIATGYTAVVQWGAEIMPTSFRATGMAILHMSAFTSNILSPFVAYSIRVWSLLPLLIFIVVAFLVGGIALLLPETKGLPLPQTKADGENVINEYSLFRYTHSICDTNNMLRTRFHAVSGSNVQISADGSTAQMMKSGHGVEIAFTATPLVRNEKVCLRVTVPAEVTCRSLIFGFTNENPITLVDDERRLAWRPYLAQKTFENNRILHICTYSPGDVLFGYSNEYSSDYFSGVDISRLWFFVHLPRVGSVVQFVEPRISPRLLRGTMKNLRPLTFHKTDGTLIDSCSYNTSKSLNGTYEHVSDGFIFSASPIEVNQRVCIHTDSDVNLAAKLSIGFTSIDPDENVDLWSEERVWFKTKRLNISRYNDFKYFYVNSKGDVYFGAEGRKEQKLNSEVDTTVPMWAMIMIETNGFKIKATNAASVCMRYYYAQLKDNSMSTYTRPMTNIGHLLQPQTISHVAQSTSQPASSIVPSIPQSTSQIAPSVSQCASQVAPSTLQSASSVVSPAEQLSSQVAPNASLRTSQVAPSTLQAASSVVSSAEQLSSQVAPNASQRTSQVAPSTLQSASSVVSSAEQLSSQVAPNASQRTSQVAPSTLQAASSLVSSAEQLSSQVAPNASQRTSQVAPSTLQAASSIVSSTEQPISQVAPTASQRTSQVAPSTLQSASSVFSSAEQPTSQIAPTDSQRTSQIAPRTLQPASSITPSVLQLTSQVAPSGIQPTSQVVPPVSRATDSIVLTAESLLQLLRLIQEPQIGSLSITQNIQPPSANQTSKSNPDKIDVQRTIDSQSSMASCVICYENPTDTVFISCGHMCSCYECALNLWTGQGNGLCPICRGYIERVLRVFNN